MKTHPSSRSSLAKVLALAIAVAVPFAATAQDSLLKVPPPDVSAEMASFSVADGFEVNL